MDAHFSLFSFYADIHEKISNKAGNLAIKKKRIGLLRQSLFNSGVSDGT